MLVKAKTKKKAKTVALKGTVEYEDEFSMVAKIFENHFREQKKSFKGKKPKKSSTVNSGCFKCGEVRAHH